MLSNLLFWMFLHTPLTIVERHGHGKKDFPEPPSDAPFGVDATVASGWLDLKVRNDTLSTFQVTVDFDEANIYGGIRADRSADESIEITNGPICYYREIDGVFEEVDVIRRVILKTSGKCLSSERVYRNRCQIRYALSADTKIIERT